MYKLYGDCDMPDSTCAVCIANNGGQDCHGVVVNRLVYLRMLADKTQAQVAKEVGTDIRTIQRYESGESDTGKMGLGRALAYAQALECDPKDLAS